MNTITIREMRPEETPLLVKWLYAHRDVNHVDLEPFRRNQVRVYVAEDETGILCFIPVQAVYMYDALAPRPDLGAPRTAKVCAAITEHLKGLAAVENVSNILVRPNDAKFSHFLQGLGYEETTRETLQMNFNKVTKSTETEQCPS